MLKELPWATCPQCEIPGYLEGDSCLRCGFFGPDDTPGSVVGHGTIMQISGGSPKNRNTPGNFADTLTEPIEFFGFSNGYSFYEVDRILRLELGECLTMKTFDTFSECYQIDSWIKMSN